MNEYNFSARNASTRRTYFRRKGNNTRKTISPYLPITTTFVTTTTIVTDRTLINADTKSIPVNDLFAPLSYFFEHKFIFLLVSSLLLLLCVLTICFLIVLKCSKKSLRTRRQKRLDKKRLDELPDFLNDHNDQKDETDILLEPNVNNHSLTHNALPNNGILTNDNISTTFSIDPLLEQKINQNNLPNAITSSSTADNTSLDTLHGSLISSPSQKIPALQPTPTSTTATTTDSTSNVDERVMEAEKADEFQDIVFTRNEPRFIKANNGSNLSKHRTSASSLEQTIRQQEERTAAEERKLLHGSNSNLIEKEMRKQEVEKAIARKQHTNSEVSLVSRTSEDSCY